LIAANIKQKRDMDNK